MARDSSGFEPECKLRCRARSPTRRTHQQPFQLLMGDHQHPLGPRSSRATTTKRTPNRIHPQLARIVIHWYIRLWSALLWIRTFKDTPHVRDIQLLCSTDSGFKRTVDPAVPLRMIQLHTPGGLSCGRSVNRSRLRVAKMLEHAILIAQRQVKIDTEHSRRADQSRLHF